MQARDFLAKYAELFKAKWGTNPEIGKREAGIATGILRSLSPSRAELLLEAFFQLPDAWLIKQTHPLGAFETKKQELVVFAETGNFTTNRQVRQADDAVSDAVLRKQIREGRL